MRRSRASWVISSLLLAVFAPPAPAQLANLPAAARTAITKMGARVDAQMIQESFALMGPLQAPRTGLAASRDIAYGSDPLQTLDLYRPQHGAGLEPIVVFVHGGGFTVGDKGGFENIPAYFARNGMLGVTIDYRLSPAVHWPAQSLDLGCAVAWLRTHAKDYGGDPDRIVVVGHSSGAAVAASYLFDRSIDTSRDGMVGGVLVSGPYGYTRSVGGPRTRAYYGGEGPAIAGELPRAHVGESKLPLLIVTAEFDPPPLSAESYDLCAALCVDDGTCPRFLWLSGHNHMTEVLGIDTDDDRLGRAVVDFVRAVAK